MTKVMAVDHASDMIRVNAICPGTISTADEDTAVGLAASPLAKMYPAGRIGHSVRDPVRRHARDHRSILTAVWRLQTDIGYMCLLLCAPASSWTTGAVFALDGGLTSYCRM